MNILVVDNDENTVEVFKAALSKNNNYKIDTAFNGKEALNIMRINSSYDLLILDIMMPDVSGIDVCESMCLNEELKNIPVILVSALPVASKTFQESLGKLNELRVIKDVLEKPFKIDDLLAKTKAILGE